MHDRVGSLLMRIVALMESVSLTQIQGALLLDRIGHVWNICMKL